MKAIIFALSFSLLMVSAHAQERDAMKEQEAILKALAEKNLYPVDKAINISMTKNPLKGAENLISEYTNTWIKNILSLNDTKTWKVTFDIRDPNHKIHYDCYQTANYTTKTISIYGCTITDEQSNVTKLLETKF